MEKYHLHNRPDREIKSEEEISDILNNGKFAIVAMCRDNEPYIVTLSYGYDKDTNALYFHSSPHGLKIDFLKANSRVCATIIEDGGYIPTECGHNYRTVVLWGEMTIVDTVEEKKHGMSVLLNQLEDIPEVIATKLQKSEGYYAKMEVLKLKITEIHAKEGR